MRRDPRIWWDVLGGTAPDRGSLTRREVFVVRRKSWGGRRAGAGRKRIVGRRRVEHGRREEFANWSPVHVTVRVVPGMPSLRTLVMAAALKKAFDGGKERDGFRLVLFSVMTNHIHFVVEAEDRTSLSRGMHGLMVRMAYHLNSAARRTGRVFADRYYSRSLGSTLDGKNTLNYVLKNARRHGIAFRGAVDPYSSGAWFTGWRIDTVVRPRREAPVATARTWQLTAGWLLHGRIDPYSIPGRLTR